ncbi:MAG: branched-chain amino acid transaminase [Anaerolineae bacterium]|nr:branched-chain amino acid transaminase [Anaerolineae bacterium]
MVWSNGELVPWAEATVHVSAHALHYGSSVFEGIRAYATPQGPAVFCLDGHVKRLFDSAKIFRIDVPYTPDEISTAIKDTIRANGHSSCYIRPLIFRGCGALGVEGRGCTVETVIFTLEWGAYLGPEAIEQGVDVGVSSWRRMAPDTFPAMGKIGGQYVNSQFAKMEAIDNGYAENIVLDVNGYVSEGSGENLFLVNQGVVYTTPLWGSILSGLTRQCVMQIARDLGYEVREQTMSREWLYIADELFFTGTAAEVTPIRSVDRIAVGAGRRGPITAAIQQRFFEITKGEVEDTHGWLTPVG